MKKDIKWAIVRISLYFALALTACTLLPNDKDTVIYVVGLTALMMWTVGFLEGADK